jgi:hypothetical protein
VNQPTIAVREIEMFFAIANDFHQAVRNGNHGAARLYRDEIEAVKQWTENTTLRDGCARMLGG